MIDPTVEEGRSLCMFMNAPGPGERVSLRPLQRDVYHKDCAGVLLATTRRVPAGYQLTWSYGGISDYFSARNLERNDVSQNTER